MIINKAILHVLDKTSDTPILNEFEIKSSQEVESFFQRGIKRVIKNDNLRKSVFNDYSENTIRICCENMIHNEDTFVENSQEIASYLFDVMKVSSEIDSCDIAICLFTNEEQRMVGIFKLDYKKLFTHSIDVVDDKFKIQFVTNNIGIQESQRFKNAAIIGVSGINDEYHLEVLDLDGEKKEVETSWLKEFLNVTTISDEKFNTRMFKKITDNWLSNVMSTDIKKSENIRGYMNHLLKNEDEIDVEKFAEDTLKDEGLKEEFNDIMKERLVDDNFVVDKEWVSKNLKKKSITTDSGFVLRGSLEDFDDPMKYSLNQNEDGTFNITIKNINAYEVK